MNSLTGEGSRSELGSLDLVIKETATTLETGQKQLTAVAENAKVECTRLSNALIEIDEQLEAINKELVLVGGDEQEVHSRVKSITQNFEQHAEDEIKAAYEGAKDFQVRLAQLTERQIQLEHKKKELETSLLSLRETAEKAGYMVSQVAVVVDFIKGNLRDINVRLENLNQRQQLGLQVIRAQEEERKRVAREIHDGPAQSMANVVLRMEFCEKLMEVNPEKVREELRELKQIVKSNLQDVRKIIFDLRPMALDDLGVIPALKRYSEDFREKHDICIEMTFHGRETRLEPVLEIALFRLIQEALNNVVKHARAKTVKVDIDIRHDWVMAVVTDDGVGFVLDKVINGNFGKRFGLISMKERTDLLGGDLHIDTRPGGGTKVIFKLPVN